MSERYWITGEGAWNDAANWAKMDREIDHFINHLYSEPGEYRIRLTVENANGDMDTTTVVYDYPAFEHVPLAVMTLDFGMESLGVSARINSTPGTRFSLDWGDGTVIERMPDGQPVIETHVYTQAGVYSVTLIPIHESGRKSRSTVTVNLKKRIVFEGGGENGN